MIRFVIAAAIFLACVGSSFADTPSVKVVRSTTMENGQVVVSCMAVNTDGTVGNVRQWAAREDRQCHTEDMPE